RRCRHGRDGARLSPAGARAAGRFQRLDDRGRILDGARRRRAAEGTADRDGGGACRRRADRCRSLRGLVAVAQAPRRHHLARDFGAAVVPWDHGTGRSRLLCRIGWGGFARQGIRRPRVPWFATGLLLHSVLGDLLAGCDAGGVGDAGGLAGAPRARDQISAGLAPAPGARLLVCGGPTGPPRAPALFLDPPPLRPPVLPP